jgi:hypothetical protein
MTRFSNGMTTNAAGGVLGCPAARSGLVRKRKRKEKKCPKLKLITSN